jgi:hypothetical protein
MDNVEVKLLNYRFLFRPMSWREEFKADLGPKEDRLRTLLSLALVEVSGLKIGKPEDAMQILKAIPSTVIYRAFLIYKGSVPIPRLFKTMGLYKAPEPSKLVKKIQEAEVERERIMDRVEQEMEQKFGRAELQEARRLELEMLRNSKGRGLTPASPEDGLPTPTPVEEAPQASKPQQPTAKPNPKAVRKYI